MLINESLPVGSEETFQSDVRWLLVQRILKSETFHRAEQLRNILSYVSREIILHPDQTVREYEVAFNALGRRKDFDATQDNIVRVQFTHLRRKLETYFVTEGKDEPLVLTIPKGSYTPLFLPAMEKVPAVEAGAASEKLGAVLATSLLANLEGLPKRTKWQSKFVNILLVIGLLGWVVSGWMFVQDRDKSPEMIGMNHVNDAFLKFLARSKGSSSIVVPDTSEMMIRMITGSEIDPDDYGRHDYPEKQIALVQDPEARRILSQISLRRNTSINEANMAFEFADALREAGSSSTIRYARDLHVSNFNTGNTILIGSYQSDPWVSLFTNQMNFRLVQRSGTDISYFENVHPLPGEQARYEFDSKDKAEREDYGHIALFPSPSGGGFVLLLDGNDMESAEGAANFLLHGQLTPQINALLARKDLTYFEIFLHGRHLVGESQDRLEVLSVRTQKD